MIELLKRHGLDPSDIGSHSSRKGCATFVCSGSTSGPNYIAVHIRAGWKFAGVGDTYIKFERAGDQFVGRVACGLDPNSAEFAMLPPFLFNVARDEAVIQKYTKRMFPRYPAHLRVILEHCLASLVYHYDFLNNTLSKEHPLRTTQLFTDANIVRVLRPLIRCDLGQPYDVIRATGIPSQAMIFKQLRVLEEKQEVIVDEVKESVKTVVTGVVKELDDRQMAGNQVSLSRFETAMAELMSKMNDMGNVPPREPQPQPLVAPAQITYNRVHFRWNDGSIHLLPEDFTWSKYTAECLWMAWWCGDTVKGYAPFRELQVTDFPLKSNSRKRLTEVQGLMKLMERFALAKNNAWIAPANADDAATKNAEIWDQFVQDELRGFAGKRPSQLSYSTIYKKCRSAKKAAAAAPMEGQDDVL